jgi:hypothetical protein
MKQMYVVRYEEISTKEACCLLDKNNGYLDGDSKCLVLIKNK